MAQAEDRDFEGSAELLQAIAHATRLQILCAVKDGERAVSEIEEATGIAQPRLSQQLAVLRKADLVLTRREGKQVFYKVDQQRMLAASDLLDALAGTVPTRKLEETSARISSGGGAAVFARVHR